MSPLIYRHDPYSFHCAKRAAELADAPTSANRSFTNSDNETENSGCHPEPQLQPFILPSVERESPACLPVQSVIHNELLNAVEFVPFPEFAVEGPSSYAPVFGEDSWASCNVTAFGFPLRTPSQHVPSFARRREGMCRLFIGQLPFAVTDAQITAAVFYATGGCMIYHIERIVHWKVSRHNTGCIHAYCFPHEAPQILSVDQSLLFDQIGFWAAFSAEEKMCLKEHVQRVAQNPLLYPKVKGFSAQPMTVELAKSDYFPRSRKNVMN